MRSHVAIALLSTAAILSACSGDDDGPGAPDAEGDAAIDSMTDVSADDRGEISDTASPVDSGLDTTRDSAVADVGDAADVHETRGEAGIPTGWSALAAAPSALRARIGHTAIWTGTDMVVWGGYCEGTPFVCADGAKYDLAADAWSMLPVSPLTAALDHSAVWTGTQMIVFGGATDDGAPSSAGAAFDPGTKTWSTLSTVGAPARSKHTAVWTGSMMLVWGGAASSTPGPYALVGARWTPGSGGGSWTAMAAPPTGFLGRVRHGAVWTGSRMIVFGGKGCPDKDGFCADAAAYDPTGNAWTLLTVPSAVDGRAELGSGAIGATSGLAAFWSGVGNVVSGESTRDNGVIFDGTAVGTTIVSPGETVLPNAKRADVAAWSGGGKLFVWGGVRPTGVFGNGASFDPVSSTWTAMPAGGPSARLGASAVWTGSEAILWGGSGPVGGTLADLADGKIYRP